MNVKVVKNKKNFFPAMRIKKISSPTYAVFVERWHLDNLLQTKQRRAWRPGIHTLRDRGSEARREDSITDCHFPSFPLGDVMVPTGTTTSMFLYIFDRFYSLDDELFGFGYICEALLVNVYYYILETHTFTNTHTESKD